jgi:cobalt-zinc-cadmium efflux system membrane fusion protein
MNFSDVFEHSAARRVGLGLALGALVLAGLLATESASSHGEQIAASGNKGGPVELTAAQQQKLGLKLARAGLRPLPDLLQLNGEVRLAPGREADASPRISGQVVAVYARLGDSVRAGQRVARVQSRLVGNPPPSVDIVASMTGVVDAVNVSIGQSVEPGTALLHLSDRSEVDVIARVYEEDLGKVRVGQTALVRTLGYPGQVFHGSTTLVGPSLDPDTRTVELWVRLANPQGLLKPHMFARVDLTLREDPSVLAVPTAAVIEANGEKFVFVRQQGAFKRVEVEVGAGDGDFTEITDGLVPGDEVVTTGNREVYTLWLTGGVLKGEDD